MIRFLLDILFLLLYFIILLPTFLLLLLLRRFNQKLSSIISQWFVNAGFHCVLFFSGTKVRVIGRDNVPKNEAVLYAGNHRSVSDIPLIYTTVPTLTGIIAKKEISKIPFLSWWMYLVNCLFLDRDNLKEGMKTILTAIDYIKNGYSMFIMPEGTRNHGEELLPFKEGSFKMAEKTGCAIIPVAIWKSDEIFEKQMPKVKSAPITIHYGKPIYIKDMSKEECKHLGITVRDIIAQMIQEDNELTV